MTGRGAFNKLAAGLALLVVLSVSTLTFAQATGSGTATGTGTTGTSSTSGTGTSTSGTSTSTSGQSNQWTSVQSALGMTGEVKPIGIIRFSFIAAGVSPSVMGTQVKPETVLHGFLAFGSLSGSSASSASTTNSSGAVTTANTLMTGEFPVPIERVAQVVKLLERNNVPISAIHKHVFGDTPRSAFIHVEQAGDATQMATAMNTVFKSSGVNLQEEQQQDLSSVQGINATALQSTFGAALPGGKVNAHGVNGVLDLELPRAESFTTCAGVLYNATVGTTANGSTSSASTSSTNGNNFGTANTTLNTCMVNALQADVSGSAGTSAATSAAGSGNTVPADLIGAVYELLIQPTGAGNQAFVAAEIPLLPTEVDAAIRILAESNLNVTFGEVHNHTKFESPGLLFMHASAIGDANQIVELFRAVIANGAALASGNSSAVQGAPASFSGAGATAGTPGTGTSTSTGTGTGTGTTTGTGATTGTGTSGTATGGTSTGP